MSQPSKGSPQPQMRQNNPYQPLPMQGPNSGMRSPTQPQSPIGQVGVNQQNSQYSANTYQNQQQPANFSNVNGYQQQSQQGSYYQQQYPQHQSPPQPMAPAAIGLDPNVSNGTGPTVSVGGISAQLPRLMAHAGSSSMPPRQPVFMQQQYPHQQQERFNGAGYQQQQQQQGPMRVQQQPESYSHHPQQNTSHPQQGHSKDPSYSGYGGIGGPQVSHNSMPSILSYNNQSDNRSPQGPQGFPGSGPVSPHLPQQHQQHQQQQQQQQQHQQGYSGRQSPLYSAGQPGGQQATGTTGGYSNTRWSQPNTPNMPGGPSQRSAGGTPLASTPNTAAANAPLNYQNLFLPKLPEQLRQEDLITILIEGVKLAAPMQLAPSLVDPPAASSLPAAPLATNAHNRSGIDSNNATINSNSEGLGADESTSRPLSPAPPKAGSHLPPPPISAIVSLDPISGASKRFGFAVFPSAEAGFKTLQLLNGSEVSYSLASKRVISIRTAYELDAAGVAGVMSASQSASQSPQQPYAGSKSASPALPYNAGLPSDVVVFRLIVAGSRFDGTQAAAPSACLYVRNIPISTSNDDVTALLSAYGNVKFTSLRHDHLQKPIWVVFVEFDTVESAQRALTALHGNKTLFPSSPPILAKFADTLEHREQRRTLRGDQPPREQRREGGRHQSTSTPGTPSPVGTVAAHQGRDAQRPSQYSPQQPQAHYQPPQQSQNRQQGPAVTHNPYGLR